MNILFITPTWFDKSSAIGGGERYVEALAEALAKQADVTLVSFAPKRRSLIKKGYLTNFIQASTVAVSI